MIINLKSSNIDSFLEAHSNVSSARPVVTLAKPMVFLSPSKESSGIIYITKSKLDSDVSDYAFERLREISDGLKSEAAKPNREKLIQLGECIRGDFDYINSQRGFFSAIWNKLLVELGFRHSSEEILEKMALIHRQATVPQFGGFIPEDAAKERIARHREVHTKNPELTKNYGKDCLTNASNAIYEEQLKKEKLPEIDPQKLIAKAKLKEAAVYKVYTEKMDDQVQKGYYDPGIIPCEIDKNLGPITGIPEIADDEQLEQKLLEEADKYKDRLSKHQLLYIKEDVSETIKQYREAYKNRSLVDAFALGRDMIRVAVYQEIYDKASFTGSDHGSKHIHHNIANAESLESGMKQQVTDKSVGIPLDKTRDSTEATENGNAKDKFMTRLIHFYHDIGYTTGLSARNFDCCKDHPFIGAKMIDENREYFKYYLTDGDILEADKAVDVFRNGVLFHAIMMPNLTADAISEIRGGMHPNLIRSLTSISDACALTYDRKTQEFWEQPSTLIAISRLRLFLVQFPHYMDKLSLPLKDNEWFEKGLLDQNNPIDVLAHEVFTKTRKELLEAVDKFDIPKDKRDLFKDAIHSQFNTFTTSTTFGQYGGVLTGVSAQANTDKSPDAPAFLPQFELAPSIIYGLVKDLYGEDLAQQSFKKLLGEFGADFHAISKQLNFIAEERIQGKLFPVSEKDFRTPSAIFSLHDHFDVDRDDGHLNQMQKNLAIVVGKMLSVYKSQGAVISSKEKEGVFKDLENLRSGEGSFLDFVTEKVLCLISIDKPYSERMIAGINSLKASVGNSDPLKEIRKADKDFEKKVDALSIKYSDIKTNIEEYRQEMRNLRSKFPSASSLQKLNQRLLDAAPQENREGLKEELNAVVVEFEKAEKKYFQISSSLRMALISDAEYAYMCGGNPKKEKDRQVADIIVA